MVLAIEIVRHLGFGVRTGVNGAILQIANVRFVYLRSTIGDIMQAHQEEAVKKYREEHYGLERS